MRPSAEQERTWEVRGEKRNYGMVVVGNRKAYNMLQLLLQIQSMTLEVGGWHAGKVKDERTAFLVVQLCHNYQDDRRWDAWGRL